MSIFELISVFVVVKEGSKNKKTHQNVDGFLSVAGTVLLIMFLDLTNVLKSDIFISVS